MHPPPPSPSIPPSIPPSTPPSPHLPLCSALLWSCGKMLETVENISLHGFGVKSCKET